MYAINPILNADSYKLSHWLQYPAGTETVSSYVESRGGDHDQVVFFGLQPFLMDYLSRPITLADINDAEELASLHGLPFNRPGWMHIINRHGGYMPVEIQAVPEGLVLPTRNVMVQLHNTDPACPWLTSYLETSLLRAVWYPTTVATVSWTCKQVIRRYLDETSDMAEALLPFKLHDFGARGVSSLESAALGGMAHLVNFRGSDTLAALPAARRYYGESMAGYSIPAAEHSTITSWGREHEADAYANMVTQFGRKGSLFAVVSDSYDLFNAVEKLWGGKLKEKVLDCGGTLVVRPDSGDPVVIVRETIERLDGRFGSTVNDKGYKVLNPAIRVIQGDGIDEHSIADILEALKQAGYAADNIAFGMGGALLQRLDRDTLKFAMKTSAVQVKGEWRDVYKDPVTDPGKTSKRGRLALRRIAGAYKTVRVEECAVEDNLLVPVFRDGRILVSHSFKDIRTRSETL